MTKLKAARRRNAAKARAALALKREAEKNPIQALLLALRAKRSKIDFAIQSLEDATDALRDG